MTTKQKIIVILSAFAGMTLMFLLNYLIIDKILIPDPCYYHTHQTNWLFDIFYKLTSDNGYHPFPSMFNYILTSIIGIMLGLTISIIKLKKIYRKFIKI